jgi:predicted choloylglycine hydrolase
MVYEGSHYEIGKKKGEFLKSVPILKEIYTSVPEGGTPLSAEEAYNNLEYFDQYCKGLKDELQGVADGMEVELKDLFYCLFRDTKAQACSQVSVLPAITTDGHHYIGRVYCSRDSHSRWQGKDSI